MKIAKAIISSLLILVAFPFTSFAEFPGFFQRLQLGYSPVVFADAKYVIESNDQFFADIYGGSKIESTLKSKIGNGFYVGTYFPMKRLGRTSSLAFSIDFMYNSLEWESGKIKTSLGEFPLPPFKTTQLALPFGVDFKFGADALNVKNHRFCATVGLGAYPVYSMHEEIKADKTTVNPAIGGGGYAKVEAGMLTGICWKVRALAGFGLLNYQDLETKSPKTTSTIRGNANVVISVIVMPFAFTWKKYDWWNTY